MSFQVQVISPELPELVKKMEQYPDKLNQGMNTAMQATLLVMTESIPAYPPPPDTSDYRRTGTLGRTLGSSAAGGKGGQAEIYSVQQIGASFEGHFGTNLEYAPYVIGDADQARHMAHWWTLSKVAADANEKITRVWQALADAMKKFIEKGN